ncbi:phosphotransferase [Nocardia sp. NPDC052566]|uniref:phosphotransferase n=1 Tax=Nocardia sp. NPDC052566 TaxID=3364330 RepID=UPI0037C91B84
MNNGSWPVMRAACSTAGVEATGAQPIRDGHGDYRLPGGVLARVGRPGQQRAARHAVEVARWLESAGVDAARVVPEVRQPITVDGRAVTFWREPPPHRPATPAEVAVALARLHRVPPPTGFALGTLTPLVRLAESIDAADSVCAADRDWLRGHLAELCGRWTALPAGLPWSVVHGAPRCGSVVVTEDGTAILLDLEQMSFGPPEWDLVHAAIECWSLARISAAQYAEFCRGYGRDVMRWDGFYLLRDIREFRMTTLAVCAAATHPGYQRQALRRLACIRGDEGPRPWDGWTELT